MFIEWKSLRCSKCGRERIGSDLATNPLVAEWLGVHDELSFRGTELYLKEPAAEEDAIHGGSRPDHTYSSNA